MRTTMIVDGRGYEWVINHHSDWSGDVDVARYAPNRDPYRDKPAEPLERYTLPGVLFREACASAVTNDLISMLEQWDGSAEAARRATEALADG